MSHVTASMNEALAWLAAHNGDGAFCDVGNTFLAAGERAPVMRATWNRLEELGLVEFYEDRKRMRLVKRPGMPSAAAGGPIVRQFP